MPQNQMHTGQSGSDLMNNVEIKIKAWQKLSLAK